MSLPTALSHPCYHDDDAARITFESVRWPNGPYCPHCGAFDTVAPLGGESMGSVTQSAAEGPMVRRLAAGGESHERTRLWNQGFRGLILAFYSRP